MPKQLPPLKPMGRIARAAAAQQDGPLRDYACRSFPIPARGFDGLWVQFLFSRASADGEQSPVWIAAPEYLLTVDAETGKVTELRPFDAPRGEWLGQDHSLERRAQLDFVEQEQALYGELDILLPALASGARPVPDETAAAARRYTARFRFLAEQPLLPYYQHLGGWFFAWVGAVAGPSGGPA
ncbi:MAG: hypothetical protein R2762_09850 [Bryobacteraceae bacterium]